MVKGNKNNTLSCTSTLSISFYLDPVEFMHGTVTGNVISSYM